MVTQCERIKKSICFLMIHCVSNGKVLCTPGTYILLEEIDNKQLNGYFIKYWIVKFSTKKIEMIESEKWKASFQPAPVSSLSLWRPLSRRFSCCVSLYQYLYLQPCFSFSAGLSLSPTSAQKYALYEFTQLTLMELTLFSRNEMLSDCQQFMKDRNLICEI